MDKNLLKSVILEQKNSLSQFKSGEKIIEREALGQIKDYLKTPHIIMIAGIRRAGKSTFLRQLMSLMPERWYYINFEDERLLNFTVSDFNVLYELFLELEGEKRVFFFDEIQNVKDWERFVRRMNDQGFKFFITGSNALLLSRELGTKLTGRHLQHHLYPFSFMEFLLFNDYGWQKDDLWLTKKRALLKKYFDQFLLGGGMPEYWQYQKKELLQQVYSDILYRDIFVRYGLRDERPLRELSFYLLNNIATTFSYNSLKKFLQLGSAHTVIKYVDYLEKSFLFFTVNLFCRSIKQQIVAPKKIYCIDNGLAQNVASVFLPNLGRALENLVFLQLKRLGQEIYYYKTKNNLEVDFFIKEKNRAKQLIQVAWSLNEQKTKDREIKSLFVAMDELNLNQALILTDNEEDEIKFGRKKITVKPVYQWLLG